MVSINFYITEIKNRSKLIFTFLYNQFKTNCELVVINFYITRFQMHLIFILLLPFL